MRSQLLATDRTCPNWLCDDPGRRIRRIDAIAYLSGALRTRIHWYKYDGRSAWALISGRLVVGWLEAHAAADPPDLIVANPTFVAPGIPGAGHVEHIIDAIPSAPRAAASSSSTMSVPLEASLTPSRAAC